MDPIFIIEMIARQLGLTDAQLGITLLFIILFANLLSRLIPDDSTGALGVIHKLSKIIGLSASNRIASGVTTTEAVKAMLPDGFFEEIKEHKIDGVKPENQDPAVVATRILNRGAKGKFAKKGE